ncbi:hypothetical protein [Streptomyces sp. NPDC058603]|uniref:hypothetical protein n=1 Tax=Streptomyces sp. NPDC058603 TaxID=3346551 RepID=UPI00365A3DA8
MNSDGWYFIALPDCAGGERVARRVRSDAQLICRHASGRPLLLARGSARQRVMVEGGAVRGAVIVVRNGARRLTLAPFDHERSADLLNRLPGGRRLAERAALDELAALCGGLPLALRILAERAARQPEVSLRRLVTDIRGEEPLNAFRLSEDGTDLDTVLSWSLKGLTEAAARLYGVLAAGASAWTFAAMAPDAEVPGAEVEKGIGPADAAALLGVSREEAVCLLDELVQVHLVERHGSDRFGLPAACLTRVPRVLAGALSVPALPVSVPGSVSVPGPVPVAVPVPVPVSVP